MHIDIDQIFEKIVGQPCTRREVGSMRSISLGFGEEAPKRESRNRDYRLWEMGTYVGDWKVISGGCIALSKNRTTNIGELDALLQTIALGRFVAIRQLSRTDIRIEMDNGSALDISGNSREDDEYFHVFCPDGRYVEFSNAGWRIGSSEGPWPNERTG